MTEKQKKQQSKRQERIAQLARVIADHQARLQVIGANWGAIIAKHLDASERELVSKISKYLIGFKFLANSADTLKMLTRIVEKLNAIRAAAFAEAKKEIMPEAYALTGNEVKWAARMTQELSPENQKALKMLTNAQNKAVVNNGLAEGRTINDWFKSLEESEADRVDTAVRDGMAQGKSVQQITKELVGTAANDYTDGIVERTRSMGVNMARTLANSISNNAKQAFYEENDDVVIGVEILATLDGRTCPACAGLDRKRYKTKESHPTPPIHHQCRCVLLPVTELSDMVEEMRPMAKSDFMADAKRAYEKKYPGKKFEDLAPSTQKRYYYQAMKEYEARTGEPAYTQVSGAVSFRDYFEKHMTPQQQKDWLGPKRYEIWKRGNLPLDKFIPPYPQPRLTVKALTELDNASFSEKTKTG